MGLVYLQGLPGLKQGGAKGVAFQLVNAIDVQGFALVAGNTEDDGIVLG